MGVRGSLRLVLRRMTSDSAARRRADSEQRAAHDAIRCTGEALAALLAAEWIVGELSSVTPAGRRRLALALCQAVQHTDDALAILADFPNGG